MHQKDNDSLSLGKEDPVKIEPSLIVSIDIFIKNLNVHKIKQNKKENSITDEKPSCNLKLKIVEEVEVENWSLDSVVTAYRTHGLSSDIPFLQIQTIYLILCRSVDSGIKIFCGR